jgi:hypothetical protein
MALIIAPENLALNTLVKGIIETLYTTDQFYTVLPFKGIDGNALQYTRENIAVEDNLVDTVAIGGTVPSTQAEYTTHTATLTTIAGDAVVNGLTMATQSSWNNQMAVQVAAKTKIIGRKYQNLMINGVGTGTDFDGFHQWITDDTTGAMNITGAQATTEDADTFTLSFTMLDQLIDGVTDKGGAVDYLMMSSEDLRAVNVLLRGAGGAGLNETRNLPNGVAIHTYRGVPMFRNDFIGKDFTDSLESDNAALFAGVVDDGSATMGISGLTAMKDAGVGVEKVGTSETKDEKITRIKWYTSLALFSERGFRYALHGG